MNTHLSARARAAIRRLPDLQLVKAYLENNPQLLLQATRPSLSSSVLSLDDETGLESMDFYPEPAPAMNTSALPMQTMVSHGLKAIHKLQQDPQASDLNEEEVEGLESIVLLEGRPALLFLNGRFADPPLYWHILEQERTHITSMSRSIGRIAVQEYNSFVGTGFLLSNHIIMTNHHVAKAFSDHNNAQWLFKAGMSPYIDYVQEFNNPERHIFRITEIIGCHPHLDIALLRVEADAFFGPSTPQPLSIDPNPIHLSPGSNIYIIGYPHWNKLDYQESLVVDIFSGSETHGKKRLQPGKVLQLLPDMCLFTHDCSTLTGNSGSCILDLATHKIIGIHYKGKPFTDNAAVALWCLHNDALFKQAGVYFG